MDDLEFHPAANSFPLMSDAELDSLGEDMLEQGQREPIILYRGKILDGRNRLSGLPPEGHQSALSGRASA